MEKKKYLHTEKDKEDDILLIKQFTKAFEDKFKNFLHLVVFNYGELDGIDDFKYCVDKGDLPGAETVYSMHSQGNIREMIWLSTGTNPNGVSKNLFARTFTLKYQKKVKGQLDNKFYEYSINSFERVIEKFEMFVSEEEIKIVEGK
jgi:hypothetical protein